MKKISRREFVTGVTVLGGVLVLGGCTPQESQNSSEGSGSEGSAKSLSFDVVVLGARHAGLGAAGAAVCGGLKVALVDKGPFPTSLGPNQAFAQLPENEESWMFESDIPDTKEDFQARWKAATEVGKCDAPYPDYERMTNMQMEGCKTIAWAQSLGCVFEKTGDKSEGVTDTMAPAPDGDKASGQMWIETFEQLFVEKDTALFLESAGTELVTDGGKVVGVVVEGPGGKQTLQAKAVVLATGGYVGSESYRKQLIPEVEALGCRSVGLPLNTGDGITMAAAVGGAMYEDGWIITKALVVTQKLFDADASLSDVKALSVGFYVTKDGKRFINEALDDNYMGSTMVDLGQGPYYGLFDSSDADTAAKLELGLSTGDIFKGETVEELATNANMSALIDTFTAYQEAAASGVDTEFSKPADKMTAYTENGPYYLVSFVPSYCATMGGIKTNTDCQVVDENDTPIEGLYAAGEITHRFMYNRTYIRAASNGSGMTMGRLVGEKLVKDLAS
jgi:succinate dehydrogenase/fumarate reductase flavoprotein subunit